MNALVKFYRKLDRLQMNFAFKVAASAVMAIVIGAASAPFLFGSAPAGAPNFLESPGTAAWTGLLVLAWWLLVIWLGLAMTYLLIAIATAVVVMLTIVAGSPDLAFAVAGIGTLAFTFVLLIKSVLFVLQYPSKVLAVAQTVVRESVRLKISVFFIVVLLLVLPLIPLLVESEQALRYRIQSFISYSMSATFYLAAFMTIFLACGTVAFEIRDRQIWQLMTKPLSRFRYLVGKWVGIVAVNLVLLVITGISIFIFVQYLRDQPAANERDRTAVENEVLVARIGATPDYDDLAHEELMQVVDRRIENDFTLRQAIESGLKSRRAERARIAREIRDEYLREQRTVEAGEMKEYTFTGLQRAMGSEQNLKLRFLVHYGADDTHETHPITFVFKKNGQFIGRPYFFRYVPTMSQAFTIPSDYISEQEEFAGTLTVGVINGVISQTGQVAPLPGTDRALNFDPRDLEVLFTVGGFEANYLRAMLVMWMKLAFLAMLGIACATLLSFPVACLTSFTIFLAATIGPFLATALEQFYIGSSWRIDRVVIKSLATLMVILFEPFGDFKPTERLIEGRLIPWWAVIKAFALLGFLWSGLALGLGYLAFRDRELATYSGHG